MSCVFCLHPRLTPVGGATSKQDGWIGGCNGGVFVARGILSGDRCRCSNNNQILQRRVSSAPPAREWGERRRSDLHGPAGAMQVFLSHEGFISSGDRCPADAVSALWSHSVSLCRHGSGSARAKRTSCHQIFCFGGRAMSPQYAT